MGGASLQRCIEQGLSNFGFSRCGNYGDTISRHNQQFNLLSHGGNVQQDQYSAVRSNGGLVLPHAVALSGAGKLRLHAFVVLPNHIHLLLTVPEGLTLERAMQLVKGGFSFEAGKLLSIRTPFWQKSFLDRRVRDAAECEKYRNYIHQNPVAAGLVGKAEDFVYSSTNPNFEMDELPQRLKSAEGRHR